MRTCTVHSCRGTEGPTPWALIIGGLLIGGLLALSTWLAIGALRPAAVSYGPHHGTLHSEGFCRFTGRSGNIAECIGTFRSDDGTLEVHDVTFSVTRHRDWFDPAEPIPGWLSGPTDHSAMSDEDASTDRITRGTIAVVLLAWAFSQSVWWVRHRARERPRLRIPGTATHAAACSGAAGVIGLDRRLGAAAAAPPATPGQSFSMKTAA